MTGGADRQETGKPINKQGFSNREECSVANKRSDVTEKAGGYFRSGGERKTLEELIEEARHGKSRGRAHSSAKALRLA